MHKTGRECLHALTKKVGIYLFFLFNHKVAFGAAVAVLQACGDALEAERVATGSHMSLFNNIEAYWTEKVTVSILI